jgi:FkbM family methyltransferase
MRSRSETNGRSVGGNLRQVLLYYAAAGALVFFVAFGTLSLYGVAYRDSKASASLGALSTPPITTTTTTLSTTKSESPKRSEALLQAIPKCPTPAPLCPACKLSCPAIPPCPSIVCPSVAEIPIAAAPVCNCNCACTSCPACPASGSVATIPNSETYSPHADASSSTFGRSSRRGHSESIGNIFLAQALVDERFTLQTVERQASHRSERLCIGQRCEGNRFLMVHQDRDSSDRILPFLLRHEHQSMEVFSTVLTSDDCNGKISEGKTATCAHHGRAGRRPLVFDVGANHGFYGLLAASTGAQVVFIDPQPHCVQYVRAAALISGFEDQVEVVHAFADAESHGTMSEVPVRSGCWGTFPTLDSQMERSKLEYHALKGGNETMHVKGISLPELVRQSITDRVIAKATASIEEATAIGDSDDYVLVMKIDAEGHEVHILNALIDQGILREKLVRSFVIEFNKPALKRNEEGECSKDPNFCYGQITQRIIDEGYTVLAHVHGPWAGQHQILNGTAFGNEGWTTADMWIFVDR